MRNMEQDVRGWLDACNEARRALKTREDGMNEADPVVVSRVSAAVKRMGESLAMVKSGHLHAPTKLMPVLVLCDVILTTGACVTPLYNADRESLCVIVRAQRQIEERIRAMLGEITGVEVEARDSSRDAVEEAGLRSWPASFKPAEGSRIVLGRA